MLIAILVGLAVLSVILFAHELGHFITAKASGIFVEEFGIGFPPRLFSFKWGETRFSLNAIPFGGFNKIAGEEDPSVTRSLASKGIGTRLLVISAGSLMNFLLAIILFSVVFMIPRDVLVGQVVVEDVAPRSPAAVAGIGPGDTILSVDEKPMKNNAELGQYIQYNLGNEVTILVQHSDLTTENIKVVPRWNPPEGQGAIGVEIRTENAVAITQSDPFWRAVPLGGSKMLTYLIVYKDGLVGIFSGEAEASFFGPVGIAQLTGEVARVGIRPLLDLAALFSLLLGIFNLLPIPAADGGRIAFILLEWVRRGKRIPPRVEGAIHMVGFALLMLFLLALTYQDILRAIRGETILP